MHPIHSRKNTLKSLSRDDHRQFCSDVSKIDMLVHLRNKFGFLTLTGRAYGYVAQLSPEDEHHRFMMCINNRKDECRKSVTMLDFGTKLVQNRSRKHFYSKEE